MITVFTLANGVLARSGFPADGRLPAGTLWIDLMEPTRDEERAVEQALSIEAPTREEMKEIELSSRIYREGEASYLTLPVLYRAESPTPQSTPITFIRTPQALVTLRYAEPQSFKSFTLRAQRQAGLCTSADFVLLGLFDAITDRAADILEHIGEDLERVSTGVFGARAGKVEMAGEEIPLEEVVRRLGRSEDLTSRIRDSLVAVGRAVSYLGQTMAAEKQSKEHKQRIKTLSRDVQSLAEHVGFLAHKGNFLLDATLGLINIQQTNIIKIFSVAAVVFLPPTLIASVYGMNFAHMPELGWLFGYPFAIGLMGVSAVLPYWLFKRRGWL
jgi:magnesium transporter